MYPESLFFNILAEWMGFPSTVRLRSMEIVKLIVYDLGEKGLLSECDFNHLYIAPRLFSYNSCIKMRFWYVSVNNFK